MAGLVPFLGLHLALGVLVGLPFVLFVGRLEPSAQGGSIGFRLLILPGAILLWPLVLARVVRRRQAAPPRVAGHVRAHRLAFASLLFLFVLALGHALHRRAIHHDATHYDATHHDATHHDATAEAP